MLSRVGNALPNVSARIVAQFTGKFLSLLPVMGKVIKPYESLLPRRY